MLNYIILLSILSSLNPFNYFESSDMCVQTKMGGRANSHSAKLLAKKYHLRPSGTGMRVDGKVEELDLSFRYYEPIADINEARTLLMNVVKDHYDNIKNYEELKPYLAESFSLENAHISLFFYAKDGETLYHPDIATASFYGSCAFFVTNDKYSSNRTKAEIKEPTEYFIDIAEGKIPPPVYKELQK